LVGAAPAYAGPSLHTTESEARAGEVVHFSISDIDEDETYVLQIGDRRLGEGSGTDAEEVSGQFTMPDLGGGERKVTVEAEVGERNDTRTVKRKLRYLGGPAPAPALTVADPPLPAPTPAPVLVPPAAPAAGSAQTLTAPGTAASEPPAIRPRSRRAPRQARPEHRSGRRQSASNRAESRNPDSAVERTKRKKATAKAKRERARTAPLFDGIPESGAGGSGTGGADAGSGLEGRKTIAPPAAALTGAGAELGDGGPAAAVLVPALLGLAALVLAGTALLRRRRQR